LSKGQQRDNHELAFQDLFQRLQNGNVPINQLFGGQFPELSEQEEVYHEYDEQNPNPDLMSYEQLLELEEKMGYVEKGFKIEEIDKIPLMKYDKELIKIDKYNIC
jgi:hypothetical protein